MLICFTRTAMGLTLHSWLGLQSHTTSITQNTANYGLSSISSRRPLSQFKWHVTLDELLNVEALSLLPTSLPPSLTPLTQLLWCRSLLRILPRVDYVVRGDFTCDLSTYLLRLPNFSLLISLSPFAPFTHWTDTSISGCRHGTEL